MADLSERSTFRTTADGDLALNEHRGLSFSRGSEAIAQEMKITLNTIQGEDPFDPEHGVPVFDLASANPDEVAPIFSRALNREHGDVIDKILSIKVDIARRERIAQVRIAVRLENGDDVSLEVEP